MRTLDEGGTLSLSTVEISKWALTRKSVSSAEWDLYTCQRRWFRDAKKGSPVGVVDEGWME